MPKQRRLSVKDRISGIETQVKEQGGDSTFLKQFGTTEETDGNPTPDPTAMETESKTIDRNEEETPETTTAAPSDDTVPSVNVKQQVKKLNIAELASISNKKKTEYLRVKEIASQEIQKLQAEIEKNSKQLADYVQTKPEERDSEQIEMVKNIRKEQGAIRKNVRTQLNLQVQSAKDRIESLLQEQRALHQAWEREYAQDDD